MDSTEENAPKLREYRIHVPPLKASLLDEQNPKRRWLLDFLKSLPSINGWFKKFTFSSPSTIFRRTVNAKEEISLSVPSPAGIRRHLFIRKINWHSLLNVCKEWLKNPMNIALLVWLFCVAAAGAMLGLLLLGLLNRAFPTTASRNHWIEIDTQVLNALFTLMSLFQHPNLSHHLVLLCLWRSEDVMELRKIYCKNGAYRPREWAHMTVVVLLLHITCFAQYMFCGLYWEYSSETRPELAENLFFAIGTAAPVFAAAYTVYSPLGREYDSDNSDEETIIGASKPCPRLNCDPSVSKPEWSGGLLDCCGDDTTVGCLSFFCTCCVFGWNMERLGFGNMYVHIVTFLLLCVAPFWIFSISALNIHDYVIGDAVWIAGIVLCVCGLIYGGFWRIQMRKRFKLPGNTFCCGSSSLTDYFMWMFCWSCSLAQEVRTGNFYEVDGKRLYRKLFKSDHCSSPLPISQVVEFSPPVQPLMKLEDGDGDTIAAPDTSQLIQAGDR